MARGSLSIPCSNEKKGCSGRVRPVRKDGRFYPHRGILINVPSSFVIPRCDTCGEEVLTDELREALAKVLEVEYQRDANLIALATKRVQ